MTTIYLAGAINGCSDAEAGDWRERVKSELAGLFEFLDPMRRDYRGVEDDNVQAIIDGDLEDIDASKIILVAADKPSWGTAMETFYAASKTFGPYILVICGGRVSPWLRGHSDEIVETLDDAITRLRDFA